METLVNDYCEKFSISDSGKGELINLFNKALIEISTDILKSNKTFTKNSSELESKKNKRFKSKKAEELASENSLSLEDFEMNDVSKKDVETKVRQIAKQDKDGTMDKSKIEKSSSSSKKSKEKVVCSGINKKGEACKGVGNIKPSSAKHFYCFRHAEDWKLFECESDSSNESELEEEEIIKKEESDSEKN